MGSDGLFDITIEKMTKREALSIEQCFPQISTIWNKELSEQILKDLERNVYIDNSAELFFICHGKRRIGITGYSDPYKKYNLSDGENIVDLCWHGIAPDCRRKGYSEKALETLLSEIKSEIPHKAVLINIIREEAIHAQRYFESTGFAREAIQSPFLTISGYNSLIWARDI